MYNIILLSILDVARIIGMLGIVNIVFGLSEILEKDKNEVK